MCLSFKYRLLPTEGQHRALERILEDQRQLYNAALQERIDCYRKTGAGRSYIDQSRALTEWREQDPYAAATPVKIQRWTLRRLDDAYSAFFRRIKNGKTAGLPRFRGKGWWRSFGISQFSNTRFDGRRIRFKGIPGGLRLSLHRELPEGRPLSCVFTKEGCRWSIVLHYLVPKNEVRPCFSMTGVDVGLSSLATLSDGQKIPNLNLAKRSQSIVRRQQRELARCKKGSRRRAKVRERLARSHRRIANARATYLHQQSARLVANYDLIATEKLNFKGLAAGMLAKPINDASWGRFRQMITYKAEKAGVRYIEVNPRGTSQACSSCGTIVEKTLADRVHACTACGLTLDRDHNAALNILRLGVAAQEAHKTAECRISVPRNTADGGTLPEIARLIEERDRIERNRDMWKGQCERQAEQLQLLRTKDAG